MDKAKSDTFNDLHSRCSSSAIVPIARTRQNQNLCTPVALESLTPSNGSPSWSTDTVDPSRMRNDLCGCLALLQNLMSALGA